MDPVRVTKSFSYANTDIAKGAIFHGALFVDDKALYLIHNKHTWESAGTATAAFGRPPPNAWITSGSAIWSSQG